MMTRTEAADDQDMLLLAHTLDVLGRPETFTIPELRQRWGTGTGTGTAPDPRNFQRDILLGGALEPTGQRRGCIGRPPKEYRLTAAAKVAVEQKWQMLEYLRVEASAVSELVDMQLVAGSDEVTLSRAEAEQVVAALDALTMLQTLVGRC